MSHYDSDSNCTEPTEWTERSESHEAQRSERRLEIAAAVLARGVRRVLGADLSQPVEQENHALPVRVMEAVMGAPSTNEEKETPRR